MGQSAQQKRVQAAICYGKGTWDLDDLRPLFRRSDDELRDVCERACAVLAAEVERLRQQLNKN
jgi:hypothetical protein